MAGTICPNSLQIEAEVLAVPASRLDETGEAELYAMRIKETYEMLLAGLDVLERAVEKYRQPARKLQHLELLSHLSLPGARREK